MAAPIIILIVAGFAAFQYLKGSFLRAFITMFILIIASIIAFAYFELLAVLVIGQFANPEVSSFAPYIQPMLFFLLFALSFAVLQTVASKLVKKSSALDERTEKAGRIVCGAISGLLLAGILFTALAMAPLGSRVPYERFSTFSPDPEKPNAIFYLDALPSELFSLVSRTGLAGKTSFAVVHPAFLDEIFLNRVAEQDIPILCPPGSVEVPGIKSVWMAPDDIKTTDGTAPPVKTGYNLVVVRVGFKKNAGAFSTSQLRLSCNEKDAQPLTGAGVDEYPLGYYRNTGQLQLTKLTEKITVSLENFKGAIRYVDFVFPVPSTDVPVLFAYKANIITTLPKPLSAQDALPVEGL
jgi:MFS family permease